MPFLGLLGLLLGDASVLEQAMPPIIASEAPLQELESSSPDATLKVLPFVIEGSVESFDPVKKAQELAQTISRKWCGTYSSFNDGSRINVTLLFSKVKPIGQIVSLDGQLLIDGSEVDLRGNLNAQSNQIELLIISNQRILDIEPGGTFLGLAGLERLLWNSPRLNNPGGYIDLNSKCSAQSSKAQTIFTVL